MSALPNSDLQDFALGRVLRHHSGRVYTVVGLANTGHLSEDYPVTCVYIGANGHLWARPLAQMRRAFSVLHDGKQGTST